jgi:hypothetical protein
VTGDEEDNKFKEFREYQTVKMSLSIDMVWTSIQILYRNLTPP